MAQLLKRCQALRRTLPGRIAEALVYAAMLALALMYFTGNGQFLYEV